VFPPGVQVHAHGLRRRDHLTHGKSTTDDPRYTLLPRTVSYACSNIGGGGGGSGGGGGIGGGIGGDSGGGGSGGGSGAGGGVAEAAAVVDDGKATFTCGVPAQTCGQTFHDETALVMRRDDHNPFFMISLVLNMWFMAGGAVATHFLIVCSHSSR